MEHEANAATDRIFGQFADDGTEREPAPVIHAITWWVYAGTERIRHTATMRGAWGYDATCSCGWDSRTGGATRRSVEFDVWCHKNYGC